MAQLANNTSTTFKAGSYVVQVTGALDLQWDIDGTFKAFTGSSFTTAGEAAEFNLPDCSIKVVNATTYTATIIQIESYKK
tara:strand:+ start:96 stop:335 length:240 start_codon:yes stop_codon:yes gene_type:complete